MRSPNRTHSRTRFYKYMPAATAKIVLENMTLRWSSPLEFNDPFDVPRSLAFDINPEDIQEALVRKFINLIENPPEEIEGLDARIQMILSAIKNDESQVLKESLIAELQKEITQNKPTEESLNELKGLWDEWLPDFRILCLCEKHDKASMWYHYADKYQGAVLEIKCIDELDSAWLGAKKIEYPGTKPFIYSADGWAELLLMPQSKTISSIIMETSLYTKSPDWEYEGEWRVSSKKGPNETGTVSNYRMSPDELGSLYLGPCINPDEREQLIHLANDYPNIKMYDVIIGLDREFKFVEIEDTK